jgi:hypothetical protein
VYRSGKQSVRRSHWRAQRLLVAADRTIPRQHECIMAR